MKTVLYVADLVARRVLDIDGCDTIEAGGQEVSSYLPNGKYQDYHSLDSEQLGPEKCSFDLTPCEFSIEEINEYINSGQYAADLKEYNTARQAAVQRVAELIEQVSPVMSELLALANEFNIPANIKAGKYTNDFRRIDAVDWDSSSMYC